ncbi:MAG: RidA family protein [Rikenellaceae bacterium]
MKKVISTDKAPAAVGPYSQAIEANGTLYVSGQIPINRATGLTPETIEEQTRQCLENIKAIVEEAGYSLENIVKTTVLLDDIGNFTAMNSVYSTYFTSQMPARACYQVAKLPLAVMVEIEAIAVK